MSETEKTEPESKIPESKIVVDSDWKEQVALEKEKLSENGIETSKGADSGSDREPGEQPVAEASEPAEVSQPDSANDESAAAFKLPPASFQVLVSMLFTQAISALGQMPSPSGEATKIDKPMAKHTIDTLEMLEEKTKGNLTDEEAKMIKEALHALRMTYVGVRG